MAASDFTEEYLKAWADAREWWQHHGSVSPYPPGYYDEPKPTPAPPAEED